MFRRLRSLGTALIVGGMQGRILRLERHGRNSEALAVARRAFAMLVRPDVNQLGPTEGTMIATLTIAIESLASKVNAPGAGARDLEVALNVLREMETQSSPEAQQFVAWIPRIEQRLQLAREDV